MSLTYLSLKGWENACFELRNERVNHGEYSLCPDIYIQWLPGFALAGHLYCLATHSALKCRWAPATACWGSRHTPLLQCTNSETIRCCQRRIHNPTSEDFVQETFRVYCSVYPIGITLCTSNQWCWMAKSTGAALYIDFSRQSCRIANCAVNHKKKQIPLLVNRIFPDFIVKEPHLLQTADWRRSTYLRCNGRSIGFSSQSP